MHYHKIFISFIFSITVGFSYANDKETSYYLGIGISSTSGNSSELSINQLTSAVAVFGVHINQYLNLELRTGLNETSHGDYTLNEAYGGYLVLNRKVNDHLSVNIRSGLAAVDISNNNGRLNVKEYFSYGAGFSYNLDKDRFLAADYIRLIDEKIDSFSERINQFSFTINQRF